MDVKKKLKGVIEGTGETGETLVTASKDLIKTGAVSVKDLIVAVLEIAKETGVDAEKLVQDVLVGAVQATKESAGAGAEAVGDVFVKAEQAAAGAVEGGGDIVKKAVGKVRDIVKEPFK